MAELSNVVNDYVAKTTGLKEFCDRCLKSERWGGNVVLMVVDAAFDSIGLNYFNSIVPKVVEFEEAFVKNDRVNNLKGLSGLSHERVKDIWANERSWKVANSVESYLHKLGQGRELSDREALRKWARDASLEDWKQDPVGRIRGVGLTTYQYLRMMGGVDTAMPDKIVKRVVGEILNKAKVEMLTGDNFEFIKTVDRVAEVSGYRPIEICWMTWLVQSEGDKIRMEKYRNVLGRI